ncbi:MAG: LysM peptidoglycan-binding domain-containing protein [Epulopiscium sp.]|jgi:hypothetical protein|nr:LysM peptidoglycan-binding domain-containing protein [Candidatus Epulonipiscium sp.]
MEKEKQGNPIDDDRTRMPEKKTVESDEDKAYYKGLYQDLPGEVVEILMQTHPLMGKKDMDPEATAYRYNKGAAGHDVETIKRARMQQVGQEIDAQMQEAQSYVPKRVKQDEDSEHGQNIEETKKRENKTAPSSNTMQYEDEDDRVQYIKIKTDDKKKKKYVEEKAEHKKRKHKKNSDIAGNSYIDDFDFARKEKEEHLNCLYEEDEYEDEEGFNLNDSTKKVLLMGGIGLCLLIFLFIQCISLSGKLAKAREEIATFNDISTKYEELQLEKLTLEDEIKALRNGEPYERESSKDENAAKSGEKSSASNKTQKQETNTGEYEIYTAKQDDTFWDISKSFYGNGAYYTRILEANGLKESDIIREGQQLKIPKQ